MKVHVDYKDTRWGGCKADFVRVARMAGPVKNSRAEVSIILTNDREMRALNKKYRGIDRATNVLSFETGDAELLGDIYISFDTVAKEATRDKKSFDDHAAHMVVHGVLHLLGYDHIDDADAMRMESMEIKTLKKIGIENPYETKDEKMVKKNNFWSRFKISENGWRQYLAYFFMGAIASLGFAPFNFWWATVLGVAGAYYLTVRNLDVAPRNNFWRAMIRVSPFGAAYALGMFWWVINSIFVVPELAEQFAIWTVPALVGIAIAGVFIFTIPFIAIRCIRLKPAQRPFLFAFAWALVLWLREWMATGFPWNPIANIAIEFSALANSMSLWGALGLTFIIIGFISSIVEIICARKNKKDIIIYAPVAIFFVLIISGLFAGEANIAKSKGNSIKSSPIIRIVQPANSAEDKATHSRDQAIRNAENNINQMLHLAMRNGRNVDLVVFPETAYPYMIADENLPFMKNMNVPAIVGSMSYKDGRVYNSMAVAGTDGKIQSLYSKSHLVPFGEYRPLGDIIPTPGQLTPGNGAEIMTVNAGGREFKFAPAICYEIIFSDSLMPTKAEEPHAIINITNDTWFGKTPGTYQHLDMVRRYAIESGLPIVRANYSGISAFVAPDGTIISSLPISESGYLDGVVGGGHKTAYRAIGRDLWMVIILLFSAACSVCISVFQKKD